MARTALVTGANRGIGLEFVRQLLARGDHVVATCRHPGKASALNALAGDHPGRLHVLPLDVADAKSRASLVHDLPLVLGDDGRIDLLLNNAGVLHSGERFGHVEQATLDDSLRTNAIGPFLLAQALAPLLRDGTVAVDDAASPCTIIANISSQLGSITHTARFGTPSYAISKAAQNMATCLAGERAGRTRHRGTGPASGLGADRDGRRAGAGHAGRRGGGIAAGDRCRHAVAVRQLPRLARRAAAVVSAHS
jgi:NAD(P)-dependent dehydrogenase (short-subunit alcohol dehydrogenase family)